MSAIPSMVMLTEKGLAIAAAPSFESCSAFRAVFAIV
jgi:hypothetical protein